MLRSISGQNEPALVYFCVNFKTAPQQCLIYMNINGRGLKISCRRAANGKGCLFQVFEFFKELRMEGGRRSGGPSSHIGSFPELVPPGHLLIVQGPSLHGLTFIKEMSTYFKA